MVQISGDGINWKDWKASTLLFDGYFVKAGNVTQAMLSGFDKGLSLSVTGTSAAQSYAYYAISSEDKSKSKEAINVSGYEYLTITGTYSLVGTIPESIFYPTYYVGSAAATCSLQILDGITDDILKNIPIASKTGCTPKNSSQHANAYIFNVRGNINEKIPLSDFSVSKLKIQITCGGGGGDGDGATSGASSRGKGTATISLTNIFVE